MSPEQLAADARRFDQAVLHSRGIDRFCSSSAWVLSAVSTIMPERVSRIARLGDGYFAAMLNRHPTGIRSLEPLELAWGLASPLVGPEPGVLAEQVAALMAEMKDWQIALLPGMSADSALLTALMDQLPDTWQRRWGGATVRRVASLGGGLDGFLSRRSRDFRKSSRRGLRRASDEGIGLEVHAGASPEAAVRLFERALAVEARSWKGREGVGLSDEGFARFYRQMMPRLAASGSLRAVIATARGRDVAYDFGAVFGDEYRGLQFSYDQEFASLSLGAVCQLRQIEELCAEGVRLYDLGTDMEYKRHWAEGTFETQLLLVLRR
jgi:hypothetical protein